MINYERVAEKLFSIIKGHGHNLVMFTDEGMETSDATESRRFFVSKPNYMITLDPENRNIKFNKNSNVGLEDIESVMRQVKNLATANMLKSEVKVFGKEITPKDFAYQTKNMKGTTMNELSEASLSRMHGSIKTSYQTLESVRMVVRHRQAVDEEVRGSRSRQIQSIFLEQNGERFRFPHNHLAGARAMARHMYEGGDMQDSVGTYIIESVGNILKLNEFVRYANSNKLINENSEDVVKTVRENISAIRKELKGLTGATTYSTMKETIETRGLFAIEEDDTGDLKDMFTVRKFDEKIGDVLPLIKKLMDNKQDWRNSILEASQSEISISEKTNVSEDDVFEFENPMQKMGYKVKSLAERMIGQDDLSAFVNKAAGKIIEGNDLSKFEKTVVRNVLENAIIREAEECVCEGCGELEEACKCGPKDVVNLISEAFELKMKMLEHEDIFTEAPATAGDVWPTKPAGFGIIDKIINALFVKRGHDEWNTDVITDHLKSKGFDDGQIHQIRDTVTKATKLVTNRVAKKYNISDDEISLLPGNFGVYTFYLGVPNQAREEAKQLTKDLVARKLDRDAIEPSQELDEAEGDKCIRCRKGTMERGDTFFGPADKCNRCGYQRQVNEDDWDNDVRRGESESGANGMGYPASDRPISAQVEDLLAQGEKVISTVSGASGKVLSVDGRFITVRPPHRQAGVANFDKDHIFIEYNEQAGHYMIVSQKDRDWMNKVDESDAEKAGSGRVDPEDFMDDCQDCRGTGKAQDSIFNDDECSTCGGEGYV